MSRENTHTAPPPGLWAGQFLHAVCLIGLLALLWRAWDWLDKPFALAFWVAAFTPVVHQIYVWLTWRLELNAGTVSRSIGFNGYVFGFFVLFGGRFLTLLVLAWLDRGSAGMDAYLQIGLTGICTAFGLYAMYSVQRYFGMKRAAGADHFDAKYRTMPLVKQGIFRFTNNGMYVYAFLLFWAIALGFNSSAAIAVAAFSHAYIWVHHLATERVDMAYLYGR